MKTSFKNILAFVFIILTLSPQYCEVISKTKVLVPKNARSSIKINISKKNLKYYPLSNEEATILSVRGPGKLKIITRVRFTNKNFQSLDYKIYYKIDGLKKISVDYNKVKRSSSAHYKDRLLGIPGNGEDLIVELGIGDHSIEFWSSSNRAWLRPTDGPFQRRALP